MIMAKRTPYRAAIIGDGLTDQQTTAYAMNSAIRATEALVRDLARSEGVLYHGAPPTRTYGEDGRRGGVYTRVWTSDRGRTVTAQAHPWAVDPTTKVLANV
jgi:hypothetical protein